MTRGSKLHASSVVGLQANCLSIRLVLAAGALAATLFVLSSGEIPTMAILPGAYALLVLVFPNIIVYAYGKVGLTILNIVIGIRYVVGPLFWSQGPGATSGVLSSSDSLRWGIFTMLMELFVVFVIVTVMAPKFLKRDAEETVSLLRPTPALCGVLLVGLFAIGFSPGIQERYNFAFDSGALEGVAPVETSTGLVLLADISLILVPLLVASSCKRRETRGGGLVWVLLALAACLPAMVVFKGSSRFSVLIPTVALLIILGRMFPRYRGLIGTAVTSLLLTVLLAISYLKNVGSWRSGGARGNGLSVDVLSPLLDAYFSGPENMGRAIDLWRGGGGSHTTLSDDLLANVAVLSRFTDRRSTTPVLFNGHFYGEFRSVDQIVPLTGQSLLHFGILGAPVLMGIAIMVLIRMDSVIISERRIELVFGYVYVTVYLACAMMLSFGSTFSSFTNVLLPLLVVVVLTNPSRYLRSDVRVRGGT